MTTTPAVTLRDLRFSYPDGRLALDGISLNIEAGEKLALVGPNGAGKSTLLLHLNGALGGLDGAVSIAGTTLTRRTLKRVRACVGLVFQDPNDQLFSPTVFDDVAFGPLYMNLPPDQVHERVRTALAQVGMSGFEERMPHRLSIGQRKRIALATVLSMRPQILALDEPSAGTRSARPSRARTPAERARASPNRFDARYAAGSRRMLTPRDSGSGARRLGWPGRRGAERCGAAGGARPRIGHE